MKDWTTENRQQFLEQTGVLFDAMIGRKQGESDDDYHVRQVHAYDRFLNQTGLENFTCDLVDALGFWQSWLLSYRAGEPYRQTVSIEVAVTREFGGEQVKIGLTDRLELHSPLERTVMTIKIYDDVVSLFEQYAARRLPSVPSPANGGAGGNQPTFTDVFDCERLSVETKDGKRFFKIKGGRWSAHGVRIWPEVLKKSGFEPESIPLEGLDLNGYEATFTSRNGQPDKVIKLTSG